MKAPLTSRLFAALVALFVSVPAHAQICGDANNDGTLNILDPIYTIYYALGDQPLAGFAKADVDTYLRVTMYDVARSFDEIFFSWPIDFTCPATNPPLHPPLDPAVQLIYGDTIPAGASQFVVPLRVVVTSPTSMFTVPLRITVGGATPTIDSVVFAPAIVATSDISVTKPSFYGPVPEPDIVALFCYRLFYSITPAGVHDFAKVYLSIPPEPVLRTCKVDYEWITWSNSPPQDSTFFPMIVFTDSPVLTPVTPYLSPEYVCGDANHDYVIDEADVQALVEFYFYCDSSVFPFEAGDVNCDGVINITDIMLIADVATGGSPTLCCANQLWPPQGELTDPPGPPPPDSLLQQARDLLSAYGY